MMRSTVRRNCGRGRVRSAAALATTALLLGSISEVADADGGPVGSLTPAVRTVSFHGYRLDVPASWRVIDLRAHPHACLRLDRPALYVGHVGDQAACPSHVVGGAPVIQVEALDASSVGRLTSGSPTVPPTGAVGAIRLPARGPVTVAVEGAGVLLHAEYAEPDAAVVQGVVSGSSVVDGSRSTVVGSIPAPSVLPAVGVNVPGDYLGKGFDACTAPSQAAMDAWDSGSDYNAVGVYIGGASRGCAQPNLTATWVSRQVRNGWHLMPTYVGRQAPCTSFRNRMSYDRATAAAQGRIEAADAVAQASALGILAPSTLYADLEGYNSTNAACVASVLSYVSGWTYILHTRGYVAAVYSSASSGIHDLSTHYGSTSYKHPDDIWIAWWNGRADIDGGSYVPARQWSKHQRVHQYAGNVTESHGGYTIQIDRDFLDVSANVPAPLGCPTNLDFRFYRILTWGDHGPEVLALQCLLARAGFNPGAATGIVGWRTTAAVRAFKISRGLQSTDSVVRRWAWTALASAGPTQFLQLGSHGSRVRKVQRALTARLQRTVAISGSYDNATRNAVMDYQRLVGMSQTGTVGPPTWAALHHGL